MREEAWPISEPAITQLQDHMIEADADEVVPIVDQLLENLRQQAAILEELRELFEQPE